MQNVSFIKFKLIYIAKPIIIMLIVGCGNGPVKQIKKKPIANQQRYHMFTMFTNIYISVNFLFLTFGNL